MLTLTKESGSKLATLPAVRLECEQRKLIDERAKLLGMTVSDYVRFCINFELNRGVYSAKEN